MWAALVPTEVPEEGEAEDREQQSVVRCSAPLLTGKVSGHRATGPSLTQRNDCFTGPLQPQSSLLLWEGQPRSCRALNFNAGFYFFS